MRVVRELTENRSKLACARTNLAERLAELQHEYMRLMRVADLSRVVSKENVAKAAKVTRSLKQVRLVRPCAKHPIPVQLAEFVCTQLASACWFATQCTEGLCSPDMFLCDWHYTDWQHMVQTSVVQKK